MRTQQEPVLGVDLSGEHRPLGGSWRRLQVRDSKATVANDLDGVRDWAEGNQRVELIRHLHMHRARRLGKRV
jgi:hypothetical protein